MDPQKSNYNNKSYTLLGLYICKKIKPQHLEKVNNLPVQLKTC